MRLVEHMIQAALLLVAACVSAPAGPSVLPEVRDCSDADLVPSRGAVITARATAVIDGDSFCLGDVEIRLRDVNAPEWDAPGGPGARRRLSAVLTAGGPVTCEVKARSWDRAIAICRFQDGVTLKSWLEAQP